MKKKKNVFMCLFRIATGLGERVTAASGCDRLLLVGFLLIIIMIYINFALMLGWNICHSDLGFPL